MKNAAKILMMCTFALLLAAGGMWGLTLNTAATVNGSSTWIPTLVANITAPADGTSVKVGDCFEVVAVIRVDECIGFALGDELKGSPFVRPVLAFDVCTDAAYDVTGTISIQGNAQFQGDATKDAVITPGCCSDSLYCGESCGDCNVATVTWTVCCTGQGNAVITVTPGGDWYCTPISSTPINWDLNWLVKPVSAVTSCPIPADHLVSDSIVVHQPPVPPPPQVPGKPFEDEGGNTWSMPPQAPANPTYVKVLTASVQPGQVLAGEPVSIMANVKNSGDLAGSYTAELTINGQLESSQKVSVPGNASTPVQFSVVRDEPGTYTIDIGGQIAYFTVVGTPASGNNNNNAIYVMLGVLVLIAGVLGYLFLRKRGTAG